MRWGSDINVPFINQKAFWKWHLFGKYRRLIHRLGMVEAAHTETFRQQHVILLDNGHAESRYLPGLQTTACNL